MKLLYKHDANAISQFVSETHDAEHERTVFL